MQTQSGKQISEVISKLRSMDEQWEAYVLGIKKDPPEELYMQMGQLFQILREELKKREPDQVEEELRETQASEELVQKLMEETGKTLRFYMHLAPLRKLENRDKTALKGLLTAIYQKYIVRLERGYLRQLHLEECTNEELYEIARYMDSMTDFYVSRGYTRQGIIQDLQDETGLSMDACGYWADLIEQNYMLLKLNYIVEELEDIKKKLKTE